MKRISLLLSLGLFLLSATPAHAALFTKSGDLLTKNVLGAADANNALQAVVTSVESVVSNIQLGISDGKLTLSYDDSPRTQDVSLESYDGDIIEITQLKEADSVMVLAAKDSFEIRQRGIKVSTRYPIEVNSALDNLTLTTESGKRYLAVLPYDAVTPLIRTKLIDEIPSSGEIELIELTQGELTYKIKGGKNYNLFDLVTLHADVSVDVSALSGDVLSVNQPTWSRILSFLKV